MGHRTTRRPGRRQEAKGPSIQFWIMLAAGLALFVWIFVTLVARPAQPLPKKRSALPATTALATAKSS